MTCDFGVASPVDQLTDDPSIGVVFGDCQPFAHSSERPIRGRAARNAATYLGCESPGWLELIRGEHVIHTRNRSTNERRWIGVGK